VKWDYVRSVSRAFTVSLIFFVEVFAIATYIEVDTYRLIEQWMYPHPCFGILTS